MPDRTKYILDERDMPTSWYNVQPDLPEPLAPPLDPEGNPIGPEQLAVLFPMECIMQEVSQERYIDIPGAVLDVYKTYRPSPLNRAKQLERVLGLPAGVKIFYKYEGVSPAGSHKPNTAIPQAYYNKLEASRRSRRRPAPGSGVARCPSRAPCTASMSRCSWSRSPTCLLYTSDAADDLLCV